MKLLDPQNHVRETSAPLFFHWRRLSNALLSMKTFGHQVELMRRQMKRAAKCGSVKHVTMWTLEGCMNSSRAAVLSRNNLHYSSRQADG